MIYISFDSKMANQIINLCDQLKIDYDIWNAEDLLNPESKIEIGLNNWAEIEAHLWYDYE